MATMYRYQLPVEQTGWTLQSETETSFTWEYEDERAKLLALWTTVNGERRQDGNTAKMIFAVQYLVAYVSRFMSLRAGDVISTGTPAGVGHGRKPPKYLQPGDVVEMGITGLGTQRHRVVEFRRR